MVVMAWESMGTEKTEDRPRLRGRLKAEPPSAKARNLSPARASSTEMSSSRQPKLDLTTIVLSNDATHHHRPPTSLGSIR